MLAAERTVCIMDPGHRASIRVAAKNGFSERGHGEVGGSPVLIMERLNPAV
jgi:RimJ/RimL family protein N-acetyltransferase